MKIQRQVGKNRLALSGTRYERCKFHKSFNLRRPQRQFAILPDDCFAVCCVPQEKGPASLLEEKRLESRETWNWKRFRLSDRAQLLWDAGPLWQLRGADCTDRVGRNVVVHVVDREWGNRIKLFCTRIIVLSESREKRCVLIPLAFQFQFRSFSFQNNERLAQEAERNVIRSRWKKRKSCYIIFFFF